MMIYDINGGRITLGGQDISDMSIEALNDNISYVSQEQFLFNTTLYENIIIGKPDASREEVLAAAEKAQCGEFLARLPKGIETMAGICAVCLWDISPGAINIGSLFLLESVAFN